MTIFRFSWIPNILLTVGYTLIGWKLITGVDREIRVARHAAFYARPAPDRNTLVKMHGREVYLTAADARRENDTFPIVAGGVFLGFLAKRMKAI